MGRPDAWTREIFPSTNHIDLAILVILAETGGGLVISNGFSNFSRSSHVTPYDYLDVNNSKDRFKLG